MREGARNAKILVIGSLNMDFVAYVDEIPAEGETVLAGRSERRPGGKGAKQAYAAGRLGAEAAMIGAVGDDENGHELIEHLNRANVHTGAVLQMKEAPTGCACRFINWRGGKRTIIVPGANSMLTPDIIDKHIRLLDECGIVLLQLEIPLETVCHAAKLAKERGKTVILDPDPAVAGLPLELFRLVDVITPNERKLKTLTGMKTEAAADIKTAARALLDLGVKTAVVTAGSRGVVLATGERCTDFPVEDVMLVDGSAAGDSFTAALAYSLSKGSSIERAIRTANELSTVAVTSGEGKPEG